LGRLLTLQVAEVEEMWAYWPTQVLLNRPAQVMPSHILPSADQTNQATFPGFLFCFAAPLLVAVVDNHARVVVSVL
jgi:hypothetical protein